MKTSLDLEVTRRCNLRCDHCFVGWSRGWEADLPLDVALAAIEEGAGLFQVLHLTGGEPFSYKGIFTLIEAAVQHGYPEVLINTNGTLLTPEVIARLAAHRPKVGLSVSLDGPAEIHDRIRGEGRFEASARAIEALLAAGVPVTVMTVVTSEVLRALADFVFDLKARHPGLAGVTLFPVGVGPEGSQKPGKALRSLTPEELRELCLDVVLIHKTGLPIGIGAYPILNPMLLAMGYPEPLLYQCTAGKGRVCIHADQSVSSCHPVKDPIYGAWQPGLLRRLHEFRAHARLARRDFDGCRSCAHKEACGHCRAFVTASGAPLFGNDEVCYDVLPSKAREPRRVRLPIAVALG